MNLLHAAILLATRARYGHGGHAERAGARVAELHARVRTGRCAPPAAHLPAAVRHHTLVAVPLGVAELAAEAEVLPRDERIDALAAGTPPPTVLRPGCLGPLLDTMNVEDLDKIYSYNSKEEMEKKR